MQTLLGKQVRRLDGVKGTIVNESPNKDNGCINIKWDDGEYSLMVPKNLWQKHLYKDYHR